MQMYSDELVQQANQTGQQAADRALRMQELARQKQNDQLDNAMKLAQLSNEGYQVQQGQPSGLFGGGSPTTVTRSPQQLPPGFVLVNGKPERDPSFVSPVDQANIDYKKSMAGLTSGGFSVGPDGEAQPNLDPKKVLENLPPEDRALVQGVTDYRIDPSKTSSTKGNQRERLVKLASLTDPTYDQTQFPTRSAYRKEFSSGKIGGNVRSFNTATQHLSELNDAVEGVPDNPVGAVEGVQRFAAKRFGSGGPVANAMTNEDTALTAVSGELANIFKNSGGTDQEISKWFDSYDRNASRESKRSFIKEGVKLMQGRIGSLDSDYQRVMGKKNPNSLVYPESQSAIDKINGQPSSSASKSKYQVVEVH